MHFGPQSAGESGDWYARKLYVQGTPAYENHLKRYGHPSKVGYKEVLRDWNPEKFSPAALVDLYRDAGARFLIIQGVHHDQFDMWDSKYQQWNSTRLGPKRDFMREWEKAARDADMRFGITFHHEYSWWWWQTAFQSDFTGDMAGVPYDGSLTAEDGRGEWWEGLDPRYLYGVNLREYERVAEAANSRWSPPHPGIFSGHLDYARWYAKWWALRMMDAVAKYKPDFIYTDGTDFVYSPDAVIRYILEIVSRDGAVGLSIPIRPDGSLDEACVQMLGQVGDWMRINGDGIYGSSAWKVFGEGADGVMNVLPGGSIGRWQAEHPFHTTDMRFTKGKDGALYAWCMTVPAAGEKLSIRSLGSASGLLEGKIASVELLGADTQVEWSQGDGALEIVYPASAKLNTAVGFRIVCE